MTLNRIGRLAALTLAGAALTACHNAPSDAQLTQLLHAENALGTDPNAPIDMGAVQCLRAWSGDVELTANLSPAVTSETAKTTCRQRIDRWIADAGRNPDKLTFDRVSKPDSVHRAMDLFKAHRTGTHAPSTADVPPRAAMTGPRTPTSMPPADGAATPPGPPPELDTTAKRLDELREVCKQAQQIAATGTAPQHIARYAGYCDKRTEQLGQRIETLRQTNAQPAQLQVIANAIDRAIVNGRTALSQTAPEKAPPSN